MVDLDTRMTQELAGTQVKRRGLIAGAAALAAGLIASQVADPQPVGATTGGPVVLGQINSATTTDITSIENPTTTLNNIVFRVENFGNSLPTVPGSFAVAIAGLASNVGAPNSSLFPIGVFGKSQGGYGGYFESNSAYGMLGYSTANGFAGCTGIANVAGTAAFAGGTSTPGAYAAIFNGPTVVNGSFVVNGGPKSAAVRMKDGSHALVYCEESPESWLADYGKAKLAGGKTTVALDPAFAGTIEAGDYHVFLTPYGESNGLHVTNMTASGFTVQEAKGGTSSLTFSWRVVGKRADIKAERLAKFTVPNVKTPDAPPSSPDAPASHDVPVQDPQAGHR